MLTTTILDVTTTTIYDIVLVEGWGCASREVNYVNVSNGRRCRYGRRARLLSDRLVACVVLCLFLMCSD